LRDGGQLALVVIGQRVGRATQHSDRMVSASYKGGLWRVW
jgi:hypothetical protein